MTGPPHKQPNKNIHSDLVYGQQTRQPYEAAHRWHIFPRRQRLRDACFLALNEKAPLISRYFFNVRDGTTVIDEDGTVLPDLATARKVAVRFAGDLLRNFGRELPADEDWKVEVTDEHGLILFTLLLASLEVPAVYRTS